MVSRRQSTSKDSKPSRPPATTPEGRENQLISLAVEAAEKQLRDGTASAQVITHFLKLGSSREQLEQDRLRQEVEHLRAKSEAMASQARVEEMYKSALDAMRAYSGHEPQIEDDYDA